MKTISHVRIFPILEIRRGLEITELLRRQKVKKGSLWPWMVGVPVSFLLTIYFLGASHLIG